jgi:hypothetical protein
MRRIIGLSIAVLFLAVLPAAAQRTLPDSFAGWTGDGTGSVSPVPHPLLGEYGFNSFDTRVYRRGSEGIDVALYDMKDASGAYGLYSILRTSSMSRADLTEHSSISNDTEVVLVGDLVLYIRSNDIPRIEPELKALIAAVAFKAHEGPLPTLPLHLPQKNVVDGSDRYILGPQALDQLFPGGLGDSLGFQSGAEAELAHYRLGGHDETLVIADFPTPQIAAQKLAELRKYFNVNGSNSTSGSPELFATRSSTMIGIVSGAASKAEADTLLDQIESEKVLTWSEPTFQFKEPSIEMMIEGSIVGALTICIFALIAGLSFGGLRLIVKRVAPGKVFDRSSHLQVLQLGLGSKAINSDDFYGYSPTPDAGTTVDKNLPDRVAMRIFR